MTDDFIAPDEIENALNTLRELELESGLTPALVLAREFSRQAQQILLKSGCMRAPEADSSWYHEVLYLNHDPGIKPQEQTAIDIILGATRLKRALADNDPEIAAQEMALLTANALTAEIYSTALAAARGKKVVKGATIGGIIRSRVYTLEHQRWKAIAKEIKQRSFRKPKKRQLARLVAKQCYPNLSAEERELKADVIRHYI